MDISGDIKHVIERKLESEYDKMEAKLKKFCDNLCERAIDFRLENDRAHNFTGNLLNSIAVVLYRRGNLVQATFSSSVVPDAIAPKMTEGKTYHWDRDYDRTESEYSPEVKTNMGYGEYDAQSFVLYYEPSKKPLFEIVCAYTTEYATWVEMQRHTTGFLETVNFVKVGMPRLLK